MTWRTFEIQVEGFPPFIRSASSRSKARYDAWQDFREPYPDVSFGDFARKCRVRGCANPADDGYGYVRRSYGVDPAIGQRGRLINEGRSSGKEGVIVYPGRSTASILMVIDGQTCPVRVHPLNVELLS